MMEEALYGFLLASGSPVLSASGSRVYWAERPQGEALPALVLTIVSSNPDYAMDGPTALSETRIQADCYGNTYTDTKALARALKTRLSGARVTQDGVEIKGAFLDGERDTSEDPPNSSERIFRISIDFMIWHS